MKQMRFFKSKKTLMAEKNKEIEAKVQAFLAEYRVLSAKHQIDIGAQLKVDQNGIVPVIVFKDLKADNK